MIKTAAKEIKDRFASVRDKHIARWDKDNPVPVVPKASSVLRELKKGKVTINEKHLAASLIDLDEDYDGRTFIAIIGTPSIDRWRRAIEKREADRKQFLDILDDAKNSFLDRVLFDHENGFLLLRDFQKWRQS